MHNHAQGARHGLSGQGKLEGHKESNPGELLGHAGKDLMAASGREKGMKAAPGASGAPPLSPFKG